MTDSFAFKTYVEEISDHECGLDLKNVVDDVLYGGQFPTRAQRIEKIWQRWCLPSRKHPYTTRFFKSTASLSAEIIRHGKDCPNIIHPFSIFMCNWEIFMIVMHVLALALFPFILGFIKCQAGEPFTSEDYETADQETIDEWRKQRFLEVVPWDYALMALAVITVMDMGVNFNSGFVRSDGREIILDRKRIASRYVSRFFIFDLLSIIPYGYIWRAHTDTTELKFQWGELNILLRVVRIYSMLEYFQRAAQRFHFGPAAMRLIPAAFVTLLCIHWFSCVNVMVDMGIPGHRSSSFGSWTAEKKLYGHSDKSLEEVWRISVFRSVRLLFACNTLQEYRMQQDVLVTLFTSLCGAFLIFYLLSEVVIVTKIYDAAKSRYEEMQNQLLEYVKYKQVPIELEKRLMEFYRYCFQVNFYREPAILNFLSSQLRQEVLLHNCRRLVEIVPFFFNVPPNLMIRVVSCLAREIVLANDVVMKAGLTGDTMYFISSGTFAIYTAKGDEVCHLKEGDHFGEIALVSEKNYRIATVVAIETSELYSLSRNDFLYAVAPDPELLASISRTAQRRRWHIDVMEDHTKGKHKSPKSKRDKPSSPILSTKRPLTSKKTKKSELETPLPNEAYKSSFYLNSLGGDSEKKSPTSWKH